MAGLWCLLLVVLPTFGAVFGQEFTVQPLGEVLNEGEAIHDIICGVSGMSIASQTLSFRRDTDVFSDGGVLRLDVLEALNLDESNFKIAIASSGDTRTYTLYVRHIARKQAGDYQCIVCNLTGTGQCDETDVILVSDVASLEVAYRPDPSVPQCSIDSNSTSTQVFLGEVVTLTCVSGSAVPAVELSWRQDGQPVTANVTHNGVNSRAAKTLTAQSDMDSAAFTCHLAYADPNAPPDDISEQCSLPPFNVVSVPVVAIVPSEPINVDMRAVFTCTVSSRTSTFAADATVWTVPDSIDASRYSVSSTSEGSVLTIASVQSDDHGTSLTCSTRDEDGMAATASEQLLIAGLPPPVTEGTTIVPPTTPTPFPLGATIAGALAGLILIILLCSLIIWYCRRRNREQSIKKKQAGLNSHVQVPMTNHSQAMPDKTANHKVNAYIEKKDYPDDRALSNPDVVPRDKRDGPPDGVDPRKWWRETMPPTDGSPYERMADNNDYPTIKGMKMPFQDRSSPYLNMHDDNTSYNPVNDRDYQHYDDRDFSDSGHREPHYNDPRYEDPRTNDHRGSVDQMPSDYDYDNQAYEQSHNGQPDQDRPDPYNEPYHDEYNDQYDDRPRDQYDDQYNDRPYDQYDDRPYDQYDDRYDDGRNDQYGDQPTGSGQYNDRYDERPDDRYDDRYGRPDGQEEYTMPPDANEDYYPKYDQDERIPDGHSSSTDQYPATPYDDPYKPTYDDQPSDPHGYSQSYSDKHVHEDDLRNSQGTPSYV